jgi:hypothetical protein
MANIQITQLPTAGAITGTESVPIVQNGVTVQTTTGAIAASPSQVYQYLTTIQTPQLPNSRYLAGTAGIGLTDGGAQNPFVISLNGTAGSLETSGNGVVVKSFGVIIPRTLTASGNGISITDGNGVSGDPTFQLTGIAAAIANASGTGMLAIVGGSTIAGREILGTANQINVASGNGSGNPTLTISDNVVLPGTSAMTVVSGTSAQQPVGADGQLRFNTSTQTFDGYAAGSWRQFSLSGGVTTFSGGSTGLTPAVPTSGAITLGGTLNVANGGTGANTLTGYVYGNGTGVMTASTTIPNAGLVNSSITIGLTSVPLGGTMVTLVGTVISAANNAISNIGNSSLINSAIIIGSTSVSLGGTITTLDGISISGSTNSLSNIGNTSLTNSSVTYNGQTVALGGSGTITANTTSALTIGTGLSGTSFNGSTPVTIAIDSTVATLTGVQTLTNKTINGPDNTLTNIANASLSNSAITINGSSVSLGASVTVTATATNALTIGTGLTGTSYNGSAPVTIAIDSTVATLTGTQTLTNKTIDSPTINTPTIATPAITGGTINNTAIGGTTPAAGAFTSVAMTTGSITTAPTSGNDIVNKDYADAIASGINFHQSCRYATTTALPANIYNNGSSGVGATLTAVVNGALSVDGVAVAATQRILVKNEVAQANNGVYTVTQAGSGILPYILTRASDFDTAGTGVDQIDAGDFFLITAGSTLANTSWVQQTPLPITVGTTALVFLQFGAPLTYSAGTGLSESPAYTFNIANTTVVAGSYGLAASVPTIAINAQGQITSASNTAIAIDASQVTTGVLAIAQGGTNSSATPTAGGAVYGTGTAFAFTAAGTAGQVLTSAGAGAPVWSGISGGTF